MRGPLKGGLFVGSAVAVGILAGMLVPSLVVAERETPKRPGAQTASLPTMPSLVGLPLDEAESVLAGRGIEYETDGPSLIEGAVPTIFEVCEIEPAAGAKVRGSARLRTALAGTCGI
jgi:hypothetical protein